MTSKLRRPTRRASTPGFLLDRIHGDEQPYAEADGAPRLTHARVTTAYTGDLAGLRGEGGYVATQGELEVAYELR